MSANLRQQQILSYLQEHGAVSVRALTSLLFVSEATVRRDLAELEKSGALKRSFGGALPIEGSKRQVPLFIRESIDSAEKNEICRRAATLVKDGDAIFADGSSIVQHLAKHLAALKDIVVITYSLKTAELMCEHHIKTYCTGGLLLENSLVCTGPDSIALLERFNPDVCFLSCKGMSLDGKFSDTSEEETAIRRTALKNARTRVMLMTKNKLNTTYFHTVCHANEVDHILTDGELPRGIRTREQK